MAEIKTEKELKLENVLSLRKKMTQPEMQQEMMKIGKFFAWLTPFMLDIRGNPNLHIMSWWSR